MREQSVRSTSAHTARTFGDDSPQQQLAQIFRSPKQIGEGREFALETHEVRKPPGRSAVGAYWAITNGNVGTANIGPLSATVQMASQVWAAAFHVVEFAVAKTKWLLFWAEPSGTGG